jgi:hypothetical protein
VLAVEIDLWIAGELQTGDELGCRIIVVLIHLVYTLPSCRTRVPSVPPAIDDPPETATPRINSETALSAYGVFADTSSQRMKGYYLTTMATPQDVPTML